MDMRAAGPPDRLSRRRGSHGEGRPYRILGIHMKGIIAVYRREMGSYFVSPIAYIVIGLFLLVSGWFFYRILTFLIQQSITAQMRAMQMGGMQPMDVPGLVIQSFLGDIG